MASTRALALVGIFVVLATGCGGEDPVQAAAETICADIDAEASDDVAFVEFERDVARERRDGMDEVQLLAAVDAACRRALTAISPPAETPDEVVEDEPDVEPAPEAPSPQPEVVDRYTDPRDPYLRDAFQLPSGNIYCALIDSYLHCDIGTGLNPIPSEPCELDWAGIELAMQGTAGPDCRGDVWTTAPTDPYPVLEYGETWSYEDITCRSSESGLSCENRSGGAFSLARDRWNAR